MIVTRFCSYEEYCKFVNGETLVNNTDHFRGGKGGSISTGFCFTPDSPKKAWRYLKGIVTPEVCMVLDIDAGLLSQSMGKYADYSNGQDGMHPCLLPEYCLTEYSYKTARLDKVLYPNDFASPEEQREIAVFNIISKLFRE